MKKINVHALSHTVLLNALKRQRPNPPHLFFALLEPKLMFNQSSNSTPLLLVNKLADIVRPSLTVVLKILH